MTTVLFRYAAEEDFLTTMETLGFEVRRDGTVEGQLEGCATPPQTTNVGIVRRVMFYDAERLANLPDVLTPTFVIDERSDEDYGEDYEPPSYPVDVTDEEGRVTTVTVLPGVFA